MTGGRVRARARVRAAATLAALGLVVATVAACGPAGPTPPPATFPPGATGVVMDALRYTPDALEVTVGTTVAWVNGEAAAHDVVADDGSFASPTLQQGEVWTRTFAAAGAWSYHCTLHPEMTGVITVR